MAGTRGSTLALAQTNLVLRLLKQVHAHERIAFETRVIKTAGDDPRGKRGNTLTGKDAFTGAIDDALRRGEIDFAVHSLKDVPVEGLSKKIQLSAFPKRGSPFDVLISRDRRTDLYSLPTSAKVGTSSVRRTMQLRAFRPDLKVVKIHGNVPTRIRKIRENKELDAVVLAEAGLSRLRLLSQIDQVIPKEIMLPAVGQGCLAVAVRADDDDTNRFVSRIDDKRTRKCVNAERSFSERLGGGCNLPIAALAVIKGYKNLRIEGLVAAGIGGENLVIRDSIEGDSENGHELGRELASRLKEAAG